MAKGIKRKTPKLCSCGVFKFLLPDLDSNQDKQNQNLSYYHYTIGQSETDFSVRQPQAFAERSAKISG